MAGWHVLMSWSGLDALANENECTGSTESNRDCRNVKQSSEAKGSHPSTRRRVGSLMHLVPVIVLLDMARLCTKAKIGNRVPTRLVR